MLISFPSRTSCSSAPTPSNTTRTGRSSSRCFFSIFLRNNLENFLEQDSIVLQSVFTNARERLEQVDDEEEEEELF